MPVNIKDDGSFEIIYAGPYKGLDVQTPQNLVDPAASVTSNNWILRNTTLQSRPRFVKWTNDLGGTNQLTGVGTFLSPAGFYHTFATDSIGDLYNLDGTGTPPSVPANLNFVARLSHLTGSNPLQWRVINSTNTAQSALYFVNGAQTVCSWDGTIGPPGGGAIVTTHLGSGGTGYAVNDTGTLTAGGANATYKVLTVSGGVVLTYSITAAGTGYFSGSSNTATGGAQPGVGVGLTIFVDTVAGGGPQQDVVVVAATVIGAKYIGTLAQHAILANTTGISGTDGPFTIRWSAVGLPTVFDPAVNINAGFDILIDFADEISGMMFLGRVAYIFHRTGITEMAPTGVGTAPFDFNHIWNAQDGTGSIYPYTIAQYGQFGAFVSTENVYMVQNYQFQPIGGMARDGIFADIHASLLQIGSNQIIGTIAPAYNDNYVYTVYQLYIPLAKGGPTAMWQYSIEGGYWERFILTGEQVTGVPTFCLVH
jgi:hypothetical protein